MLWLLSAFLEFALAIPDTDLMAAIACGNPQETEQLEMYSTAAISHKCSRILLIMSCLELNILNGE
jgi:hypothetical protein